MKAGLGRRGQLCRPGRGEIDEHAVVRMPDLWRATTASLSTAVKAHQVGSPTCAGELELIKE